MIDVEFEYNQKPTTISCKKKCKLKKVCIKFAKEENLDINKLVFLTSGKSYSTKQELKTTLEKILTKEDIEEGKIRITVIKSDFERSISAISINASDDFSENSYYLIHREENHLLLKLYLILLIKFFIITIIFFFMLIF